MAGKMQEGISVADLDADSLNESAENTQEDQIQDQIQNDQLEDAQLDDSLSPEHYDASDLRAYPPGHVYRLHRPPRPAPSGV